MPLSVPLLGRITRLAGGPRTGASRSAGLSPRGGSSRYGWTNREGEGASLRTRFGFALPAPVHEPGPSPATTSRGPSMGPAMASTGSCRREWVLPASSPWRRDAPVIPITGWSPGCRRPVHSTTPCARGARVEGHHALAGSGIRHEPRTVHRPVDAVRPAGFDRDAGVWRLAWGEIVGTE